MKRDDFWECFNIDSIEKFYNTLSDCLKRAKYTRKEFAKMCGINSNSLQTMFSRKSEIKISTADKLLFGIRSLYHELSIMYGEYSKSAGLALACQSFLVPASNDLDDFFVGYALVYGDEQRVKEAENNISNKIMGRKIQSLENFSDLFKSVTGIQDTSEDSDMYFKTLVTNFDKLNEKGQEIAAERVEELTKIPEYRKDNE